MSMSDNTKIELKRERSRDKRDYKERRPSLSPSEHKPDYSTSGKLHRDRLMKNGVLLKYAEPPEARKSDRRYRLYVFRQKDQIGLLKIHAQTAYLVGKEDVCDILLEHPSISKQHAVLQYRQIVKNNEFGENIKKVKLYIIDLDSANGTRVNQSKIPQSRYFELQVGDVIQFGYSTREYVLMDESMQ
jgi:smad nuclear-interacting protein 1